VSLAWNFHQIWCTERGLKPFPENREQDDAPGFIAHIDAPWGGGKTTFANYLMRTLNPQIGRQVPEFLKELYPDRQDMSGLFMSAAHEMGELKDEEGRYRWDVAARRPWITLQFNAWLHQHVEPPWWCFYQVIRKACFKAIRREGVPTVFQRDDGSYATERDGPFYRFALWLTLWRKELWWRLTNGKVVFQLSVTLFALVVAMLFWQLDLIAVEKDKPGLQTSAGIGLVIAFLTGAGSFITAATTVIADALAPGRSVMGDRMSLGSGDPLDRFRRHFARFAKDVGRPILVVIDDLDRCKPSFIVELMRGLQTILTSPRVVYLLLGDRNWIEQAFEVQHEGMNTIDVGPEHTFGGRFVEKAIQLSFVIPGMAEQQGEYVREVLRGHESHTAEDKERISLRKELANLETIEQIDQGGRDLESGSQGGGPGRSQAVREEMILRRASQTEDVQEAISHRLQPIAGYLPSNPRHIKRIINAISMYQDSILLTGESLEEAGIGMKRWRELVIGVILMMGYPRSWSILASEPELADEVIRVEHTRPKNTDTERDRQLAMLRANEALVGLLRKTELKDPDGKTVQTIIGAETVRWLNRIIPANASARSMPGGPDMSISSDK